MRNGPLQTFKCYSAVTERYPSVRARYWANFEAVRGKGADEVARVLADAFPKKTTMVRIHSAGDFFSAEYFRGWMQFAASMPNVHFWAFTKSLPFWIANMDKVPANLELQASYGGKHDALIEQHKLKFARVVYSVDEAQRLGLEIDTDDRLAATPKGKSFALLENFTARRP